MERIIRPRKNPSLVTCNSNRVTPPGFLFRKSHRTGHGNVRTCFVLSRQPIEQPAEPRHSAFEILQPGRRAPDFDAHGRPDDLHLAAGLDAQELAKSLGDHQPAAAGQLDRPVPRREQPAEELHLANTFLELARPHLLLDQFDPLVEPGLPDRGTPQAQAARPLLGQDAVGRFGRQGIPQFAGDREPITVVERPLKLAEEGILAWRAWRPGDKCNGVRNCPMTNERNGSILACGLFPHKYPAFFIVLGMFPTNCM